MELMVAKRENQPQNYNTKNEWVKTALGSTTSPCEVPGGGQ